MVKAFYWVVLLRSEYSSGTLGDLVKDIDSYLQYGHGFYISNGLLVPEPHLIQQMLEDEVKN